MAGDDPDRLERMGRHYTSGHGAGDVEGTCRTLQRLLAATTGALLSTMAQELDGEYRAALQWRVDQYVREELSELVRRHGHKLVQLEAERRAELLCYMPPGPLVS